MSGDSCWCESYSIDLGLRCRTSYLIFRPSLSQIASGVIFGPTLAVISHWWKRRRGLAFGIIAIGSSIGGTIIPIIFRNLVFRIGSAFTYTCQLRNAYITFIRFPWTMRIIGFLLMCSLTVSNLVRCSGNQSRQ